VSRGIPYAASGLIRKAKRLLRRNESGTRTLSASAWPILGSIPRRSTKTASRRAVSAATTAPTTA